MSQEEILKIVGNEPGIEQRFVHLKTELSKETVTEQVQRLAKKGELIRELRSTYKGKTYALFLPKQKRAGAE